MEKLENWNRKEMFDFFEKMDDPYLSVTTEVKITEFINSVKQKRGKLYGEISWLLLKSINEIEELKVSIHNGEAYKNKCMGISFTALQPNFLFDFSKFVNFEKDKLEFLNNFNEAKNDVEKGLKYAVNQTNIIYFTCMPNTHLTGLSQPINFKQRDYITRICWGKVFQKNDEYFLPFNIHLHHGIADGFIIENLVKRIEKNAVYS